MIRIWKEFWPAFVMCAFCVMFIGFFVYQIYKPRPASDSMIVLVSSWVKEHPEIRPMVSRMLEDGLTNNEFYKLHDVVEAIEQKLKEEALKERVDDLSKELRKQLKQEEPVVKEEPAIKVEEPPAPKLAPLEELK